MYTIRQFRPDDHQTIREITAEAFDGVSIDQGIENEFGQVNGRSGQGRQKRHGDVDVARDPAGIFVAENEDGELVGAISTWCDHDAGTGHIPNLVIASGYRGQGIGRALIHHALDRFRSEGLTHARIETLVQNEVGRGLYQSVGFREVARQIHFAMEL